MQENPSHEEQIRRQCWSEAVALRYHLACGGALPEIPRPPLNIPRSVKVHADVRMGYSRWYAADVTYTRTSTLAFGSPGFVIGALAVNAFGNSIRRRQAEAMAAPQWREHQVVPVLLTSESVITFAWNQWQFWYFDRMMTVTPDFAQPSIFFTFSGGLEPLRLQGLASAWLFVAVTYSLYGPDYLRNSPDLHCMGPLPMQVSAPAAIQERVRGLPG